MWKMAERTPKRAVVRVKLGLEWVVVVRDEGRGKWEKGGGKMGGGRRGCGVCHVRVRQAAPPSFLPPPLLPRFSPHGT